METFERTAITRFLTCILWKSTYTTHFMAISMSQFRKKSTVN